MALPFDRRPHRALRRFTLASRGKATVRVPAKWGCVVTQLALVEGVHFDLALGSPRELGHKCLALALSDLAAAGASPLHAQLTLGTRQETSEPFLMEFQAGSSVLAKRHGLSLELSSNVESPTAFFAQITAVGTARPKIPRGARPGDLIAVTGSLGGAAAALQCLHTLGRHELTSREDLLRPQLLPEPRLAEAKVLLDTGAVTSISEVADGLAADLHTLVETGGVGAILDEERLPVAEQVLTAADLLGTPEGARSWVLYGAEDFELLVTLAPKLTQKAKRAMAKAKLPFTIIGEVTERRHGVKLAERGGQVVALQPKLWHPFVRRRKAG